MSKMIPHRIIHKRMEEHELFRKLKQVTGQSLLDEPSNMIDIECEAFHMIPLSFESHPIIVALEAKFKPFLKSEPNICYLPIKPHQAYILDKSPYGDPPIESYVDGIKRMLDILLPSPTFERCKAGDEPSLITLRDHVLNSLSIIRQGLESQQILATYPYTDADFQRDNAMRNSVTKH